MTSIAVRVVAALLMFGTTAAACESAGCTMVFGIPVEARMTVWACATGPGAKPRQVSDELVVARWTHKAHVLSPDRQANVIHREGGFEIHFGGRRKRFVMDLKVHNPRGVTWHTDSRRFAFWAPIESRRYAGKRVALLDVRQTEAERPFKVIYTPTSKDVLPFGMSWSPTGDALYVIERHGSQTKVRSVIKRIVLATQAVTKVVDRPGTIDFFSLAPRRSGSFQILYGAESGFRSCDPHGKGDRALPQVPGTGLFSLATHPRGGEVALYCRFPSTGKSGKTMPAGVYRVDVQQPNPTPKRVGKTGLVRALWYSPKGTYLGVSTAQDLTVQGPKGVVLSVTSKTELRGLAFSRDETKVAYGEGNRVLVRSLANGGLLRTLTIPPASKDGSFVGDVRWTGDDHLLVTQVSDATSEQRARREKLVAPFLRRKKD